MPLFVSKHLVCHCRDGEPLDCSNWCAKSSAIEMNWKGRAASQAGSRCSQLGEESEQKEIGF
jgi:hypothetical protein